MRHKADERGWEIIALEAMPDHVHLFVKHDAKSSASYVADQLKGLHLPRCCARSSGT
ncbi:transposase [Streptomyces sp. NPDC051913]|uniref:transposase n=1 Tax=Streptomyces sp. NPDC051913 TaxID=3365676 RepID=UPI0037D0C4D9